MQQLDTIRVLLDTQAAASCFKDEELLTNLRSASPLQFVGVGGSIVSTMVGEFEPFGAVHFHTECPENILSFSELVTKFKGHESFSIGYDQDANALYVELSGSA